MAEQKKDAISIPDDPEMAEKDLKKIIDNRKKKEKYREALIKKGLGFAFIVLSKSKDKKGRIDVEGIKKIYKKAGEKGDFVLAYDCAKILSGKFLENAREFAVNEAKKDRKKMEIAIKMFLANSDEKGVKMLGA